MPNESADQMLAKVEDYKVPKELKALVKDYSKLSKMSGRLKIEIGKSQAKTAIMEKILFKTDKARDMMLGGMKPKEKVSQQPEPNPNFQINY